MKEGDSRNREQQQRSEQLECVFPVLSLVVFLNVDGDLGEDDDDACKEDCDLELVFLEQEQ